MEFDRALELKGDQLAGMFGAMDAGQYQDIGKEQVFDAFGAMGF